MGDIPDQHDLEPSKIELLLAEGEQVQKRLGRVLVPAIAGVDDG